MMTSALMFRTFASLLFVIGLLVFFVWALRRGMFRTGAFGAKAGIVVVAAVSLGERRSVVIVAVEGRRLLLGLATGGISLLTELAPAKSDGRPS
jgi:flagellar biosynthetic protein FliO